MKAQWLESQFCEGSNEVCCLCPWSDVTVVINCCPLHGRGQNLRVSVAKVQAAALCWHSGQRQHKPNWLRSLGCVFRG